MTKEEREVMRMALEALEDLGMKHFESTGEVLYKETFTAIKEALAQPEQEPVAYWNFNSGFSHCMIDQLNEAAKKNSAPLYTTPPQRTWVGLTDEEILAVNMSTVTKLIDEPIVCDTDHNIVQLGKAIEAKLKEKNT